MNFLRMVQQVCSLTDKQKPSTIEGSVNRQVEVVKIHVNRAYHYLWLSLGANNEDSDAETTVVTIPNQNYVESPYNVVTQIAYGSFKPLRILPWPEYEADYVREGLLILDRGAPSVCAIYQRRIYLWPMPEQNYTLNIRGRTKWAEMEANDDEPLIDAEFHDAIVVGAQFFQAQYEGDPNADRFGDNAQGWLRTVGATMNAHWGLPPRIRTEDEFLDEELLRYER